MADQNKAALRRRDSKQMRTTSNRKRVYIGGIEPSRGLKAQDVIRRIEKHLVGTSSDVALEDIHLGSRFTQFTIVTTETGPADDVDNNTSSSTIDNPHYEAVRKMFHNVTWKGCKLKVEEARPTFLERLQLERQSNSSNATTNELTIHATATATIPSGATPSVEQPPPRRHWKVKRRFAEPLVVVDTHPYRTDSWESFKTAYQRSRRRQQQSSNIDQKSRQKSARYNRSIHLRLAASDTASVPLSVLDTSIDDQQERKTRPTTVASLRESDEDDEVSTSTAATTSSQDGSLQSPMHEKELNTAARYVWSDEESSEDETNNSDQSTRTPYNDTTTSTPAIANDQSQLLDEFSAGGMDFDSNPVATPPSNEESEMGEQPEIDLTGDMDRNMSLLTGLLGEAPTKPDRLPPKRNLPPPMLRFDPTDPNAQQNYLVEESDDDDDDDRGALPQLPDTTLPSKLVPESAATAPTKQGAIYEQQKLEAVFKESREAQSAEQHTIQPETSENSGNMMFSFGFDTVTNEAGPQDVTIFSAPAVTNASNRAGVPNDPTATTEHAKLDQHQQQHSEFPEHLHLGLFEVPSAELLQNYVKSYFFDGDGSRIINDTDSWRQDPSVKEKWLQERHALTLDWKNKRRAALDRKRHKGPLSKKFKSK